MIPRRRIGWEPARPAADQARGAGHSRAEFGHHLVEGGFGPVPAGIGVQGQLDAQPGVDELFGAQPQEPETGVADAHLARFALE